MSKILLQCSPQRRHCTVFVFAGAQSSVIIIIIIIISTRMKCTYVLAGRTEYRRVDIEYVSTSAVQVTGESRQTQDREEKSPPFYLWRQYVREQQARNNRDEHNRTEQNRHRPQTQLPVVPPRTLSALSTLSNSKAIGRAILLVPPIRDE